MLRREKRDVELTLPKKTETVIEVELTLTQKRWYRAVFERNRNFLMQGPSKKAPSLINVLMQLRKVCNHPFLVTGSREAVYEEHLAVEAAATAASSASAPPVLPVADGDTAADTATPPKTEAESEAAVTVAAATTAVGGVSASEKSQPKTDTLPPLPRLHIAFPGEEDANNGVREVEVEVEAKSEDVKEVKEKVHAVETAVTSTDTSSNLPSDSAATSTSTSTSTSSDPVSADSGPIDSAAPLGDDPALKDPLVYCSGKIVFLHKLLIKLKKEKSKSLIFSQFTTTLDVIQEYLNDYGYPFEVCSLIFFVLLHSSL
jgi:SNF2 family DNA or RNA helicase